MTTALQIMNRAAEIIGFKDPDEALDGTTAANFLDVLNSMLDAWNTKRMYVVTVQTTAYNLAAASPVTIGPGQTINVTRPVRMQDGAFTRINGIDFPMTWITRDQYAGIPDKSVTGQFPELGYYDPGVPTGSIYFWPVPSATIAFHLPLEVQLTQFADLATDYDLAQGYKRALEYSLAEEIAPGRRQLDPQIARLAASARKLIKNVNAQVPLLQMGPRMSTTSKAYILGA